MGRKKKTGVLAVAGATKKNLTIDDDEYEQPQDNIAPVLNAVTDEDGVSEKVSDDHDQGFILVETKKKKKKKNNKEEDQDNILVEHGDVSPDHVELISEHGDVSPDHVEPISEEKAPLDKEEENPNLDPVEPAASVEGKKKEKKGDLFTGGFSVLDDDDDDEDEDEDEDADEGGSKEEEEREIREKDNEVERIEAEKKKSKREKKKKRMLKKKLMVRDERILSQRRRMEVTIACLSAGLMITAYLILSSL